MTTIPRPSTLDAEERDRLRAAVDRRRRVALKICDGETWLADALMFGPQPVAVLIAEARKAGISHRGLVKAAQRLRVLGRGGPTWSLPGSE